MLRGPLESGPAPGHPPTPSAWATKEVASVGSVGDSYDNAMAESVIGPYKSELITM
jgi:transposase InsO family protein